MDWAYWTAGDASLHWSQLKWLQGERAERKSSRILSRTKFLKRKFESKTRHGMVLGQVRATTGNVFQFKRRKKRWKRSVESENRLVEVKALSVSIIPALFLSFPLSLLLCVCQLCEAGYLINSNRGSQAGRQWARDIPIPQSDTLTPPSLLLKLPPLLTAPPWTVPLFQARGNIVERTSPEDV